MGFWEWHKKMWNSKEPVVAFQYLEDGEGNSDFKMDILGSKIYYKKGDFLGQRRELNRRERAIEVESKTESLEDKRVRLTRKKPALLE